MTEYNNNLHQKKNFNIDIGNRCTLQCWECERTKHLNRNESLPGGDMTLEQFDKLSNFFQNRMISFCGTWGDPIYNPDFINMLKLCKKKNIQAEVHTAASHKPESWYEEAFLANNDAVWWFGIDGLPEQSHIYRKNQDGKKLFDIMLKSKQLGMEPVWQYLVFDYNRQNIRRAKRIAKRFNIELLLIYTTRNKDVKF